MLSPVPTRLDGARSRVYLAPLGLWLTLEAGAFEAVEISGGRVRVTLAPATAHTPAARLRIEQPARVEGVGPVAPAESFALERGAYVIPLTRGSRDVVLRADR